MNIYEKLQEVKIKLAQKELSMTGVNEFAKYGYFELEDFLIPLNELMQEYKMAAYPSFTAELATLTVINCEKPEEQIVITSPMGTANLKGCHEVQNIGAVETYQRRYLYMALFDIAEHDGLNATQGKEEIKAKPTNVFDMPGADKADHLTLFCKALDIAGMSKTEGAEIITDMFGKGTKVNDLDEADFCNLIAALEK